MTDSERIARLENVLGKLIRHLSRELTAANEAALLGELRREFGVSVLDSGLNIGSVGGVINNAGVHTFSALVEGTCRRCGQPPDHPNHDDLGDYRARVKAQIASGASVENLDLDSEILGK